MWIFLGVVVGALVITTILIFITATRVYRAMFNKRYNDNNTLKYLKVEDYEGLKKDDLSFPSNKGQKLSAHVYYYDKDEYKGLIVVSHAIGAGHLPYMPDIIYFANEGYKVFAFDDTGCLDSEGNVFPGFPQAVIDLEYALHYIDTLDSLKDMKKVLYGHSMGAYAAINVLNYYNNISSVIALSTFDEPSTQITNELASSAMRNMKPYKYVFKLFDSNRFKKYCKTTTLKTLMKTKVPVYLISSELDKIVNPILNYEVFKRECENDETKEFLLAKERYHRPNLTIDAAKYDNDTNEEYYRMYLENKCEIPQDMKDEFYNGLDYDRLNKLDDTIMESMIKFIEKNK